MNDLMMRISAALLFVSADDRKTWLLICMAIKSELGEEGFEMWDEWSATSESYNARDCRTVWKSIKPTGGVTIRTLFHHAKKTGWTEAAKYEKPTAAEIAERHKARAERDAQAAAQEALAHAAAAMRAAQLWDAALPAPPDHPYLLRKGIEPHGLRVGVWEWVDAASGEVFSTPNQLLVAVRDRHEKLHSLQFIDPTGKNKRYLADGVKKGNFYAIGEPREHGGRKVFVLAEGFATAASVHEATGHIVLVCFDAGNLLPVAQAIRARQPDAILIFAADNDIWTKGNPGMTAARKSADAVSGLVAFPPFTQTDATAPGKGPTDWNDWKTLRGAESVADLFAGVLTAELVRVAAALPAGDEQPQRRIIEVTPGELGGVVDAGEWALLEQSPDLYQRGQQIVRPVRGELVDAAHGTKAPATKLHPLNKHGLVEALTQAADWVKPDGRRRADGEVGRVNCPMNVAETLLARGQWRLRPLTAIINAPTLRADGSVLDAPGYDQKTGLLLERGAQFGAVPDSPSRADAHAALERLSALVAAFPFVGPEDRAVWLAALLTACVRRSLPTAPMFAFSAPTAGSGKSLLVDLIAVIASGSRAPVFSQGRDEVEMEKRLSAALLAGYGMVSIDNCTLPLDGDLLCQALTQPILTIRPLGGSIIRSVPASATFFATGNSLVIAGDMTRRVLLCSLDPGEERPELRCFDFNPLEQAQAGRAGYLVDVLTILRAYQVAGRPKQPVAPLGSFEAWSDLVRGALLWLDFDDPVRTMERTRSADPKLTALRAVMAEWFCFFAQRPVLAREAIDAATELRPGGFGARPEFVRPDFREALLTVAGVGGSINSRTLGKWLSSSRGRIVGSMRLLHLGVDRNGIAKWRIEQMAPL
ncbi:PriCT-2 domain-containing protein [Rhodoferax antarcticus]|uniref:PriCT-2 domain-containing protein n=1 Tax=Rhodoferax antarcticus TaxID=81479 RepID=UPI0022245F40|nr:PriCT-2 domain-containing protein [Rhodoferax antarcticus]MCW2313994.1 phage/plasmid primase-like uncharacterized protein [Rhodoferax antarcticus]